MKNWDGIDPTRIRSGSLKVRDLKYPGQKFYLPKYEFRGEMRFGNKAYRSASLAELRSAYVVERWRRMARATEKNLTPGPFPGREGDESGA